MAVSFKKILSKMSDALFSGAITETESSDRTGLDKESIKQSFIDHLVYLQGKFPAMANKQDYYLALAYLVRDRILQRWISTAAEYTRRKAKTVAYLSAEYLMGPHLENNLINLGVRDIVDEAMREMGLELDELIDQEEEPGLGNGGLGRLAACFLDSLATLECPSIGYGIRYEFGIFDQEIENGWQIEKTDKWLRYGNPWELIRPEWSVNVQFGGHTEQYVDEKGTNRVRWIPGKVVKGIPYDTPILGYCNHTANTLRLWRAEAPESFDFPTFNRGNYYGAVEQKVVSENLSKVLYPNDEQVQGKELRLEQQMFFVSCALQDMIRILKTQKIPLDQFHTKFAVQLNDTHPAIAVVELMRLLIDESYMGWDEAWKVVTQTFAYTNHTLLPEALEKWPIAMMARVLPRHLEIIMAINTQFLQEIRLAGLDESIVRELSLIDEAGERYIRMANLATVGSYAVNGVALLHSQLLKSDVLKEFHVLWPHKFSNKTNGVTPRRWMVLSNPGLTALIDETIGDSWVTDLDKLVKLEKYVDDPAFREKWRTVKSGNKLSFARRVKQQTNIDIDPNSMFDVQVKRIHEYKRQHLNVLHIIHLYLQLKNNPHAEIVPRTFLFGGKAAPGYHFAKLIIKLINSVADVVNSDPASRDFLKVVFLPNFNVSNGQWVYPAAELSEQISTAGKEASGTGNMKFAMNGALTVGTLDGANVEIRDEVGADNFFLFGLTVEEIKEIQQNGYHPASYYQKSDWLRHVIDSIKSGVFSNGDKTLFQPVIDNLLYSDPFLVLADFDAYCDIQANISKVYKDINQWNSMSILNTARSGKFSSDRTIREYCQEIWDVKPRTIKLLIPSNLNGGLLQ